MILGDDICNGGAHVGSIGQTWQCGVFLVSNSLSQPQRLSVHLSVCLETSFGGRMSCTASNVSPNLGFALWHGAGIFWRTCFGLSTSSRPTVLDIGFVGPQPSSLNFGELVPIKDFKRMHTVSAYAQLISTFNRSTMFNLSHWAIEQDWIILADWWA